MPNRAEGGGRKSLDVTWVESEDLPEGSSASGQIALVLVLTGGNDRTRCFRRDGGSVPCTVERQYWTGGVIDRQGKGIR